MTASAGWMSRGTTRPRTCLHEALRRVLGSHVRQAGSLVAPDRLRFDFTHVQAMTPDDVREVERLVNDQVRRNAASVRNELTYTKALEAGYLAFFGDKYGETVRVIDMGLDDPNASNALSRSAARSAAARTWTGPVRWACSS